MCLNKVQIRFLLFVFCGVLSVSLKADTSQKPRLWDTGTATDWLASDVFSVSHCTIGNQKKNSPF